jgi:hypothetical protein
MKPEQIPTTPTTAGWIMSQPQFALGVADVRARRGFHPAYDTWGTDAQWCYERGRQWARLTPTSVALKRNGKISVQAVAWFERRADIL